MPDRSGGPLVLVSNRGPVTFQEDGSVKRGTGGLVTALTGLASHRDATWIASAMTDRDLEVAAEHGGRAFEVLERFCTTEEQRQTAIHWARESAKMRWFYFDGIYLHYELGYKLR